MRNSIKTVSCQRYGEDRSICTVQSGHWPYKK